jgi:hypothetical protein
MEIIGEFTIRGGLKSIVKATYEKKTRRRS